MATTAPLRAGINAARDYQDLPAWQKAIALVETLYGLTFASEELKNLAADRAMNVATRIAASSVRANEAGIAAGYLEAQSSLAELATVLTIAERLGLEDAASLQEQIDEISRLIIGMRHGLKVKAKDEEHAERAEAKLDREHEERQFRPKREFKPRDGDDRPRREYKPRDRDGEERPKRAFKSRDGEDRPRREYKPRDGDDRPRREFKPRDGDDRPRREYKPRDGDERPKREYKPRGDKPYGEKKAYGDKKPYGDRKPYGDKKPFGGKGKFGDKPFRKPRRDD